MQKFWELMLWHIYGIDTLEYVGYYFQAKICFSKKKICFSNFLFCIAATPVFLPGESHGQKSLAGYSPWDRRQDLVTKPQLISDVVTVSGKQQRGSAIQIHVSVFPRTPLPSRLPHNILKYKFIPLFWHGEGNNAWDDCPFQILMTVCFIFKRSMLYMVFDLFTWHLSLLSFSFTASQMGSPCGARGKKIHLPMQKM